MMAQTKCNMCLYDMSASYNNVLLLINESRLSFMVLFSFGILFLCLLLYVFISVCAYIVNFFSDFAHLYQYWFCVINESSSLNSHKKSTHYRFKSTCINAGKIVFMYFQKPKTQIYSKMTPQTNEPNICMFVTRSSQR